MGGNRAMRMTTRSWMCGSRVKTQAMSVIGLIMISKMEWGISSAREMVNRNSLELKSKK
jgi:hypothetical protein